jgi:hypothetical protein
MKTDLHPKIVCGLHRSGTTYVGSILSHSDDTMVIHELFNYGNGLSGVEGWYPYVTHEVQNKSNIVNLIQNAINFKGRLKRLPKKLPFWKLWIYKFFGGPLQLPWLFLRLKVMLAIPPKQVIWKDPFCTFMLDYLTRELKLKAVCVVRHPCALYYSINKQKWQFDIDYIYQQKDLIRYYAADIPEEIWAKAKSENIYSIAILWKIMSRIVSRVSAQSSNLLVVRHEDLCNNTIDECKKIYQHLDIPFSEKVKAYVNESSNATDVEIALGDTKNMNRNSKAIAKVWKGKITEEDERVLRRVIAEDWEVFYE